MVLLVSFLFAVLFPEYLYMMVHFSFFDSGFAGGGTFDLCCRKITTSDSDKCSHAP
jgi:hypothetical protein